jgi:hypothetical protein
MDLKGLMISFRVFKIKRAVHLKDRFGNARSPASRLGGSHCGTCGGKKFLLIGLQYDPVSYNSTIVPYSFVYHPGNRQWVH